MSTVTELGHLCPKWAQQLQEHERRHLWKWVDAVASSTCWVHAAGGDRWRWERKSSRWLLNVCSSLIFHWKETYCHLGLAFYSPWEVPITQKRCALSRCLPCAAGALAPKTPPNNFSCCNEGLDGGFLFSAGPRVQDLKSFGRSLFLGLTLPLASRMLFDYQRGSR